MADDNLQGVGRHLGQRDDGRLVALPDQIRHDPVLER